jgi:hypothetical protein
MHKIFLKPTAVGTLLACLTLFLFLRIPSLVEPYWYGDEGIYAVIGHSLREGAVLYRDIWDNKPPILYLLYASVEGNLFGIKLLSLVFGLASVSVFYYLAQKLFKKRVSIIVGTALFALLLGLPLLEGNIANAENFMLLPLLCAAASIFLSNTLRVYFLGGLFLSIALMTKVVAVFDIAAFLFVIFLQNRDRAKSFFIAFLSSIKSKKNQTILIGVISLPVVFIVLYTAINALPYFLSSVFTKNVDYVGQNNHFLFPLGWVALKIFLLISALALIYKYRKKFTFPEQMIFTWMIFAVFSMFFSERPYTHYVLMGIIPFSLLISCLFERLRIIALIAVIGISFLVYSYFPIYKKNILYYTNYGDYIIGKKSFNEYVGFFDKYAVRDYMLADSVLSLTASEGSVYFWSDSAQLYMLTQSTPLTQYIVAYHSLMYEDALQKTITQLHEKSPKYIVSTKGKEIPQELLTGYTVKYIVEGAIIYEKNN